MASHALHNTTRSRHHLQGLTDTARALGVRHQPGRGTRGGLAAVRRPRAELGTSMLISYTDSAPPKPESEIQAEIRNILKQIVSTVTFLPVIDEPTVFNILAYTKESADVPANEWVDTDPLAIEASKSQQVKLRSFSTDVHRIEAMVAYRYEG